MDFCGSKKVLFVLFSADFLTITGIFLLFSSGGHLADVPIGLFS